MFSGGIYKDQCHELEKCHSKIIWRQFSFCDILAFLSELLFTMKPPYSGRLIQWTSLYNGHFSQEGMKWHNSYSKPLWQTLVTNTLCTGHFIADIIFRSNFTLLSRTDHSIEEKPNNRSYEVFLVRRLYKFNFGQCFTISFKFSSIFVILSWDEFNGPFRSIKMRNCKDFQSVFTSMIDVFSSCKDVQCAMGSGWKYGYNHGDFCCTWTTTSSLKCELEHTTETAFLSNSLVGSFTHYKHSPTSGSQTII